MSNSEDDLFNSKFYASADDAWSDVKYASGAQETAGASAKLVGKTLWNVGVFSAKLGVKFLKEAPRIIAESSTKSR